MQNIIVLLIVGLFAQLIDGALGMAYGATSTTLLLIAGIAPASASASVHLAEVGTCLMSGTAHWRFGNIDWRIVRIIAGPGAIGAFLGAFVLTNISTEAAEPWMAGVLFAIGAYILVRFTLGRAPKPKGGRQVSRGLLAPLGLFAGFIDATGGGGWGPISTPTLMLTGKMEPRKVIGSVDTSEFLVASAASVGFILGFLTGGPTEEGFAWAAVGALLAGGLVAAPVAAWLVRYIKPAILGASVGGILMLTNTRTLFRAIEFEGPATALAYGALLAIWGLAVWFAVRREGGLTGLPPSQPPAEAEVAA